MLYGHLFFETDASGQYWLLSSMLAEDRETRRAIRKEKLVVALHFQYVEIFEYNSFCNTAQVSVSVMFYAFWYCIT